MNQRDPNQGIPPDVLQRYTDASRERMLAGLLHDVESLLREVGKTWEDLKPVISKEDMGVKAQTMHGFLHLNDLNRLAQQFGLEPHIVFRPRVLRNTVDTRREGDKI